MLRVMPDVAQAEVPGDDADSHARAEADGARTRARVSG
jgi:hypothetical protein